MPRVLTDADVVELRGLAAAGRDFDVLADEYGVSVRHVRRLVRGHQRVSLAEMPESPVADALGDLLAGLDLDAAGLVNAAAAMTVAVKLDAIRASSSAAAAAATPGLVRALGDTVRELRGVEADAAEVLRRMLEPLVRSR